MTQVDVNVSRRQPPLVGFPHLDDGMLLHPDLRHRGLLLQVRRHTLNLPHKHLFGFSVTLLKPQLSSLESFMPQ